MSSKRWTILACLLTLLVVGFYATRFVMAYGYGKFSAPPIRSDVPVTADIGWWSDIDCLTVTEFSAEAIGTVHNGWLNANQQFVNEYHIVGTLQHDTSFRPSIDSVFISDRFAENENRERYVDVLLRPQIDLNPDDSYTGSVIPFDI